MNKNWFHITLLILIVLPIAILCVLDYTNLEGYNVRYNRDTSAFEPWDDTFFDQNFTFDLTWKGRMFFAIFAWFMIIETTFGWREIGDKKPKNRALLIASLVCAAIPTVYVLATNFFGLDFALLKWGLNIGIPSVTAANAPSDFLHLQWPLSMEYVVFFVCFLFAIFFAYRLGGIKAFSISLALLGAMSVAYMLDTIYPFGVFRPLQEFALPTAATSAALFDISGYTVMMNYPVYTADCLLPSLTVGMGDKVTSVAIAWACAGVYSLFLYVLIILVFFRRTTISGFRKVLYFFIGLFGTFFANVLRITTIILINLNEGSEAGMVFHNTWGELFGFFWIFGYILIIVAIERLMLVERTRGAFQKLTTSLGQTLNKMLPKQKAQMPTAS